MELSPLGQALLAVRGMSLGELLDSADPRVCEGVELIARDAQRLVEDTGCC